ncbi:hypothetical protein ABE28_009055 [Peribacillus muralis]|uniref:Uncharacterized protein n=1 Tax=Peribacillus muralis TaxID=264697 RepID=A0A1B3XMT6_9BACI|nr:hypothetical protein [Peribacillus muralis]AOH54500.1 hypothetical protein ABE28_009055 [Peribacillus muralis]
MIEVFVDHSYEDDYHCISQINVNLAEDENKRINKILSENNDFGGAIFNSGLDVELFLSNALNVDQNCINIEILEIDLL